MNVYYYSRVSQLSIDLLRLMDSYGVRNKFMLMCVDDMEQIPSGIVRIPTLVVNGINKPLVANEAIEWFENNKQFFVQQNAEMQGKINLYYMTKNLTDGQGPKGFSNCEQKGMSDEFAYTDTDIAQPKEFCSYGNDGDIIITPPKDGKMNNSSQKKLIGDLEEMRKTQEIEYSKIMKNEQVNKIIMMERDQLMKRRIGI